MATPLTELLNAVLTDAGAREQFQLAPEAFLRSAGYRDLDAADVQEALFVLADGSEPVRAARLLEGGKAIGDPGDLDGLDDQGLAAAGQGLATAIEAVPLGDTAEIDDTTEDLAEIGDADSDTAFGSGSAQTGDADVIDLLDHDSPGPAPSDSSSDATTGSADELSIEPQIDDIGDPADTGRPVEDLGRHRDDHDEIDDGFEIDDWDVD